MADTTPLRDMIARHLDQSMIQKIAQEYGKGRLLLVGTTNLDQGRLLYGTLGLSLKVDTLALES